MKPAAKTNTDQCCFLPSHFANIGPVPLLSDAVIRHDGFADPAIEAYKLEPNIKILERELIERPEDPDQSLQPLPSSPAAHQPHDPERKTMRGVRNGRNG